MSGWDCSRHRGRRPGGGVTPSSRGAAPASDRRSSGAHRPVTAGLARDDFASVAWAGSVEVSAVLIGPVAGAGSSPAAPGPSAVSRTGWLSTASEASRGASAAAGSVATSVAGTTPGSCPAVATGGSSDVVAPAATRRFRNRCDALPAFPLRSPFRLPSVRLRVERTTVVRGGLRTAMVRGPVRCRG